jgi:hypothetical protein
MPFNANLTVKTITASLSPYTVSLLDDLLLVDTSSGAVSIVLIPTKDYVKHPVDVIKTTSDASAVTVTISDGSLINGAASYVLSSQWDFARFINDGTGAYNTPGGTYFSGVTPGTAAANKPIVLGATKNIATITSATITTLTATSIIRTSQTYQLGRGGTAKAGTTAGWTVNAGNNLGTIATVAQSQTSSTLVVAIPNLHVGDTITGFSVYSSINSAGNAVTLDANLRSLTIAAGATATDASIASITQVSVTAATASTATKGSLSTVVAAGVNYYLLLTATTAASTTLELDQIEVTVTTA